ncbi:MAG: phytase [Porticoccaceae bacterium]|nr:phytase [Porticoccaceae bacterium]
MITERVRSVALIGLIITAITARCAPQPLLIDDVAMVSASIETDPVTSINDAADDPAVWVHPIDFQASLIIATDKQFGLEVYGLDGKLRQRIAAGLTNNIDIRTLPSPWEEGSALLAASNRTANTISLFVMSPTGELNWLSESEIQTGLDEVYGLCLFKNADGIQVFINDKDGRYQQWGVVLTSSSGADLEFDQAISALRVRGTLLREFEVTSQPEGCAADDENERLFVGVEAEGVYTLDANANVPAVLSLIAAVDGESLAADVEGMDIFTVGEAGYLVVSSQGDNTFALFNRHAPYSYVGSFTLTDDPVLKIDGVSDTDGLTASSQIKTPQFPEGLIVVQDGANTMPLEAQNFKLVSWQLIADALNL